MERAKNENIDALLGCIEGSRGGDRSLDESIAVFVGHKFERRGQIPHYTTSYDASMAMLPQGFSFHLNFGAHMGESRAYICQNDGTDTGNLKFEGRAGIADAPRAICAAAIRARNALR